MEDTDRHKPFKIVAVSDRGSVRERNEDYFGIFDPETEELVTRRGVLIVVTDGMGGHFSGAEASRLAVEVLGAEYYDSGDGETVEVFARAFREANRQVFMEVGEGKNGLAGTTCTAAVLFPDHVHLMHVGDSRAYKVSGGKFTQLTKDHSVVGELVRKGMISNDEARNHPRRNVITRAMGLREDVEIDIQRDIPFREGETILLCSDGLFSMLTEKEIATIVSGNSPKDACAMLIERAKEEGGQDNITLIVARRD